MTSSNIRYLLLLVVGLLAIACGTSNTPQEPTKQPEPTTRVFLVRHAEKEADAGRNPSLTKLGKERAERLQFALAAAGITQVYSSEFDRTKQTAQPLADSLGVKVQLYDHQNPAVVDQIISQHLGESILIVGHSNTVPSMVNHLLQERIFETLDEMEYNKLFVATKTGKEVAKVFLLQY